MRVWSVLFAALAAAGPALAQTSSACDPTERDCPNNPALGTKYSVNFKEERHDDKLWSKSDTGKIDYQPSGALYSIAHSGEAPMITSKFYIMWGEISVSVKAAKGRGIVSSVVLLSDTLDEIDWEWLGGEDNKVLTNYFSQARNDTDGRDENLELEGVTDRFYTYKLVWTEEQLEWWVDGHKVRTVKSSDAKTDDGDTRYPQTPMSVRIGSWAGGDKDKNSEGTVKWAGGETNFSDGPFVMRVENMTVTDYSDGREYRYKDREGVWESIEVVDGESDAKKRINRPRGVAGRWNAIPSGGRIAIIASSAGVFGIILLVGGFFCIRNRRAGKRERMALDAEYSKGLTELDEYRQQMLEGRFANGGESRRGSTLGNIRSSFYRATSGAPHAGNPYPARF